MGHVIDSLNCVSGEKIGQFAIKKWVGGRTRFYLRMRRRASGAVGASRAGREQRVNVAAGGSDVTHLARFCHRCLPHTVVFPAWTACCSWSGSIYPADSGLTWTIALRSLDTLSARPRSSFQFYSHLDNLNTLPLRSSEEPWGAGG